MRSIANIKSISYLKSHAAPDLRRSANEWESVLIELDSGVPANPTDNKSPLHAQTRLFWAESAGHFTELSEIHSQH